MTKIAPEHLARQAVVYIRQSTADQVINNRESQRRQYGLAERARQLEQISLGSNREDSQRFINERVCRH